MIKNRVDNLNESTLFILNEGVAPFAKLKGAARALDRFAQEVLDHQNDPFDRMEK